MAVWINLLEVGAHSYVEPNGRIINAYTRMYQYRTDAPYIPTADQIVIDLGIFIGSLHPDDIFASCEDIDISMGPTPTRPPHTRRIITVSWSTKAPFPNAVSTDPTLLRTEWEIGTVVQTRYIVRDRNGQMIVNAAGSPYDGGIPVDVRLGVATATRNIGGVGYDKSASVALSGKLNSTTFLGGAALTVQTDMKAKEYYEGAYHFWAETYTFTYDPLGWQPKPMNAGFFQRESVGSNVLKKILNGDLGDTDNPDDPVQEPEPLDANGILVPPASRPSGCTFITVDAYASYDPNTLNL